MKTLKRKNIEAFHLLSLKYVDANREERYPDDPLSILKESNDKGDFQISLNDEDLSGRVTNLHYRVCEGVLDIGGNVDISFEEYRALGKPEVLILHGEYTPSNKKSWHHEED